MADPTKTILIRNQATREIQKRFEEIKRVVKITIENMDINTNAEPAPRSNFIFLRNPAKIKEFERWLNAEIQKEILQGTPSTNWMNVYVGVAYARGIQSARMFTQTERLVQQGALLPSSVFNNPAHIERAELIYTRVYSSLSGVTKAMEAQMSEVLSRGIIQGESPRAIAAGLSDRIDKIGKVRARLIARTEIVNAHNVASIREAQNIASQLGEEIKMLWITALDGRERDTHRARNGKLYTFKKVSTLIGEPNCRCSVTPVIQGN